MKKSALALCAVLLVSMLAACGTGAAPSSSSSSSPASSSAPAASSSEPEGPYYPKAKTSGTLKPIPKPESTPAPAADAPAADPAPAPAPAPQQSSYVGTFYDASGQYSPEYTPSITFAADGSFDFYVNLLEGMGNIYGGYAEGGGAITCTVTSRNFSGFAGDTMGSFSFTIVDGNTLVYNGEMVGGTLGGTYFMR